MWAAFVLASGLVRRQDAVVSDLEAKLEAAHDAVEAALRACEAHAAPPAGAVDAAVGALIEPPVELPEEELHRDVRRGLIQLLQCKAAHGEPMDDAVESLWALNFRFHRSWRGEDGKHQLPARPKPALLNTTSAATAELACDALGVIAEFTGARVIRDHGIRVSRARLLVLQVVTLLKTHALKKPAAFACMRALEHMTAHCMTDGVVATGTAVEDWPADATTQRFDETGFKVNEVVAAPPFFQTSSDYRFKEGDIIRVENDHNKLPKKDDALEIVRAIVQKSLACKMRRMATSLGALPAVLAAIGAEALAVHGGRVAGGLDIRYTVADLQAQGCLALGGLLKGADLEIERVPDGLQEAASLALRRVEDERAACERAGGCDADGVVLAKLTLARLACRDAMPHFFRSGKELWQSLSAQLLELIRERPPDEVYYGPGGPSRDRDGEEPVRPPSALLVTPSPTPSPAGESIGTCDEAWVQWFCTERCAYGMTPLCWDHHDGWSCWCEHTNGFFTGYRQTARAYLPGMVT